MGQPDALPGPTGESNQLSLHGRGVFVCISPWNFPLAIFTGQVAAALAAGNAVIAKPADQTVLIGHAAVKLLHEAGVPEDVLQFVPGKGSMIGNTLLTRPEVAGVCMTGSTETAWTINRTLAARNAPIAALIAETGGQNALIADSSALPEQLVKDAVASAFDSAGQRCSAARVLFVQDDIADKVIAMLSGAMDELKVGDPGLLSTDVGPVIDEPSRKGLADHAARMDREARLIKQVNLGPDCANGTFLAPRAYELKSLAQLTHEVFGPILHVLRWKADELDAVIDADQRDRLRPHPRHPQPHRFHNRTYCTKSKSGQLLRQPQPDRRRGRRATVRRRESVGYRAEGRWTTLSAEVRDRADVDGEHDRRGRQRFAAHARRVIFFPSPLVGEGGAQRRERGRSQRLLCLFCLRAKAFTRLRRASYFQEQGFRAAPLHGLLLALPKSNQKARRLTRCSDSHRANQNALRFSAAAGFA